MAHKTFQYAHRVGYAECTVGNHVYHSRFLDILERARGEFFRHLGFPLLKLQEQNIIFPVRSCEMKFRAMARYDDPLTIELWVDTLGRARFSCASRILDESRAVLHEAVIDLACTTVEGRPTRLPEPVMNALSDYVAAAGAG